MAINVCLSTTDSVISRVIRWVTRATVSHAFITFRDDTLNQVFVMEANGRGFMLVPWKKWVRKNRMVVRYALATSEASQQGALQSLAKRLGDQYDYISLFGFVLRRFFKRMANPLNDSKKLICSEAVAVFLHDVGLDEFQRAETFTPQDIYQVAERSEVFVRME